MSARSRSARRYECRAAHAVDEFVKVGGLLSGEPAQADAVVRD